MTLSVVVRRRWTLARGAPTDPTAKQITDPDMSMMYLGYTVLPRGNHRVA